MKLADYGKFIIAIIIAGITGYFIGGGDTKALPIVILVFLVGIIVINPYAGLILSVPLVLWLSYVDFLWVAAWDYIIILLVITAIAKMVLTQRGVSTGRYSRRIIGVTILIFMVSLFVNMIHSFPIARVALVEAQLLSCLFLGFCMMYFIGNEKKLKIFISIIVGSMCISAFVGIMQFVGVDFFWQLRGTAGFDEATLVDFLARTRICGLANYSIPFSYQLTFVTPFVFGILIGKHRQVLGEKIFFIGAFSVCFVATVSSLVRSAFIGVLIGMSVIAMQQYDYKRTTKQWCIIILFSVIVFVGATSLMGGNYGNRFRLDMSAVSRVPAQIATVKIALKRPTGIGRGPQDSKIQGEYERYYRGSLCTFINRFGANLSPGVLKEALISPSTGSHNQFLNMLLVYGVLGFVLLVMFYVYIYQSLIQVIHCGASVYLQTIAISLLGGFSAYIVNSLFHNNGPFLSDPFNWYFIGMTVFLTNYCSYDIHGRTSHVS